MPREPRYWMGSDVGTKDDFGNSIIDEFIDGRTRYGSWAIMSLYSFKMYGTGLGMGKGQRYKKQPDGKWLKVEG